MHKLQKLSNGCYIGLTEMPDKSVRIEAFRPAQVEIDGYEGKYDFQQLRLSLEAAESISKQILEHINKGEGT